MRRNKVREIKRERELKGTEKQAVIEIKKMRCLAGYVQTVKKMNTEARLDSISQRALTYRLINLYSLLVSLCFNLAKVMQKSELQYDSVRKDFFHFLSHRNLSK
jgi:hypothetical protein